MEVGHAIEHGPDPHVTSAPPQAPVPAHRMSQGPSAQMIRPGTAQASWPEHSIRQGQPAGHVVVPSMHRNASHWIVHTPPSQPPLQTSGHVPGSSGSKGQTGPASIAASTVTTGGPASGADTGSRPASRGGGGGDTSTSVPPDPTPSAGKTSLA